MTDADVPDENQPTLQLLIDEKLAGGSYANVANVWHTPHEFTIDFGVIEPPRLDPETGAPVQPVRVTSRVRLPISVVFPLVRALSDNIAQYEASTGSTVPTGTDVSLPPDFLEGGRS